MAIGTYTGSRAMMFVFNTFFVSQAMGCWSISYVNLHRSQGIGWLAIPWLVSVNRLRLVMLNPPCQYPAESACLISMPNYLPDMGASLYSSVALERCCSSNSIELVI